MKPNKLRADLRESYVIVFLAVWLCMLFSPFTPLLSDMYEHTFNSAEHHARQHELGINHTDARISNIMDQANGSDKDHAVSGTAENPFVFFTEPEKQNLFEDIHIFPFRFGVLRIRDYLYSIQSPPPEAA